jgi:hypothetical protein
MYGSACSIGSTEAGAEGGGKGAAVIVAALGEDRRNGKRGDQLSG